MEEEVDLVEAGVVTEVVVAGEAGDAADEVGVEVVAVMAVVPVDEEEVGISPSR